MGKTVNHTSLGKLQDGATNGSMGINYSSATALLLTYTMVLHLE